MGTGARDAEATRPASPALGALTRAASAVPPWAALAVAAPGFLVACHAVLPPYGLPMLALRIAATEAGVWLLLAAIVALALAALPAPRPRMRLAAALLAIGTGVPAVWPWRAAPAAFDAADRSLAAVIGPDGLAHAAPSASAAWRRPVFSARLALLGDEAGAVVADRLAVPCADGTPLPAIRYRAPGAGGRPVVVVYHGGGWRGGSVDEGAACHRRLAALGCLVYAVGYRFAPATRFPGQLDDARAALAWVAAHAVEDGGDPTRIALMGRSAGAQLAMVVAYSRADPAIRAVVSWYGPVDLAEGWRHPPSPDPLDVRKLLGQYIGGTPDERPEAYAQASPLTYASRPQPPTLLLSAVADHAVLVGFQHELRARLVAAGNAVALVELPWAEHAFDVVPEGPGAQVATYALERFLAWAFLPRNAAPAEAP